MLASPGIGQGGARAGLVPSPATREPSGASRCPVVAALSARAAIVSATAMRRGTRRASAGHVRPFKGARRRHVRASLIGPEQHASPASSGPKETRSPSIGDKRGGSTSGSGLCGRFLSSRDQSPPHPIVNQADKRVFSCARRRHYVDVVPHRGSFRRETSIEPAPGSPACASFLES